MPLDPSQVQWDDTPNTGVIDASQVQWDDAPQQSKPKEQNWLQKFDAAITPDALSGNKSFQRATQFASGVIEGAASVPLIVNDFIRAGGQAVGVPNEYLPYGSQKLKESLSSVGITQPEQEVGSIARFSGNVAGSAMVPLPFPKSMQAQKSVPGADAVRNESLKAAGEAGYSVPRSNIKQSILTNLGERFGGKQAIEATAQIKNQPVTNKLAAKALGLSDDTPITPELLSGIRDEAGKAYEVVKRVGTLNSDKAYRTALGEIRTKFAGASNDFPELANQEVGKLVRALSKKEITPEGAIEQIKNLRNAASSNLSFGAKPSEKLLGKAQRKAAEAMEDLIERNIGNLGKDVLKNYKSARQLIAKTYSVERALNTATGNVSATELAKLAKKGVPLSGELKQIADFSKGFHKISREPMGAPPSGGLFEPLVYSGVGGALTGASSGDPIGAIAGLIPIIGKPLARSLMTTVPKASKEAAKESGRSVQKIAQGAIGALQGYRFKASELKQRIAETKEDKELTNRKRREQVSESKNEMNRLFREARQELDLEEFRAFREFVEEEEDV